jgi:hypothetical protein
MKSREQGEGHAEGNGVRLSAAESSAEVCDLLRGCEPMWFGGQRRHQDVSFLFGAPAQKQDRRNGQDETRNRATHTTIISHDCVRRINAKRRAEIGRTNPSQRRFPPTGGSLSRPHNFVCIHTASRIQ